MRVMLNCMVLTTTRINSPPRVISDRVRSLNQLTFWMVCKSILHIINL